MLIENNAKISKSPPSLNAAVWVPAVNLLVQSGLFFLSSILNLWLLFETATRHGSPLKCKRTFIAGASYLHLYDL